MKKSTLITIKVALHLHKKEVQERLNFWLDLKNQETTLEDINTEELQESIRSNKEILENIETAFRELKALEEFL